MGMSTRDQAVAARNASRQLQVRIPPAPGPDDRAALNLFPSER